MMTVKEEKRKRKKAPTLTQSSVGIERARTGADETSSGCAEDRSRFPTRKSMTIKMPRYVT